MAKAIGYIGATINTSYNAQSAEDDVNTFMAALEYAIKSPICHTIEQMNAGKRDDIPEDQTIRFRITIETIDAEGNPTDK